MTTISSSRRRNWTRWVFLILLEVLCWEPICTAILWTEDFTKKLSSSHNPLRMKSTRTERYFSALAQAYSFLPLDCFQIRDLLHQERENKLIKTNVESNQAKVIVVFYFLFLRFGTFFLWCSYTSSKAVPHYVLLFEISTDPRYSPRWFQKRT